MLTSEKDEAGWSKELKSVLISSLGGNNDVSVFSSELVTFLGPGLCWNVRLLKADLSWREKQSSRVREFSSLQVMFVSSPIELSLISLTSRVSCLDPDWLFIFLRFLSFTDMISG
uniref:Uncharacterized protein n=1 Tax=Cacopsylla melanoneura TaxID=428564 RepID=A0A8D8TVN6_9HEMI